MNAWAEKMQIKNVKMIPDGSGNFTRFMGMLIGKNHLGFGMRSWRYMAIINDGVVEQWWQEPGINNDGEDDDPYGETTPENLMNALQRYAMNYYKVRFKPYDAKRKINRLGVLINESDISMFFKEVTDKGEDKLSFDKKNNREVENYFSVLKNEAEFKPLKIKSRL